jgi:hypothetical protein
VESRSWTRSSVGAARSLSVSGVADERTPAYSARPTQTAKTAASAASGSTCARVGPASNRASVEVGRRLLRGESVCGGECGVGPAFDLAVHGPDRADVPPDRLHGGVEFVESRLDFPNTGVEFVQSGLQCCRVGERVEVGLAVAHGAFERGETGVQRRQPVFRTCVSVLVCRGRVAGRERRVFVGGGGAELGHVQACPRFP